MKVLYISLKADFGTDGDVSKGYAYEYTHFWDAWQTLVQQQSDLRVASWWIDQSEPEMLQQLVDDKPDLIWAMPVNWSNDAPFQILEDAVNCGIPVVQFDCDPFRRFNKPGDPWILERYRRKLATHFLTPAPHTVPLYETQGMPVKVMHFGCPTWIDRQEVKQNIEVSFVGQCHGLRQQVIQELRDNGIRVKCFGHFWPEHEDNHPLVTEAQMCDIFNRSKINLNLTWISQPPHQHQIKGRHFELLGAGAFQIATYGPEEMEGLDEVMVPGWDFVQVYTIDDLVTAINIWLPNNEDRQTVMDNAYKKRRANLITTRLEEFLNEWGVW
jgi:hypothetical protein